MAKGSKIVDKGDEVQVTAEVENVDALFAAPAFDPFAAQPRTTAVVDEIVNYLRSRNLRRPPDLVLALVLPAAEVHKGLETELESALQRYASVNWAETDQELAISRFEGRARLPWGIIVAVVALVAALLLHAILPESLQPLLIALTPVITVIIWVAIWNPAESLLYENWGLRREKDVYAIIGKGKVTVHPQ